jgi:hypothetical protein
MKRVALLLLLVACDRSAKQQQDPPPTAITDPKQAAAAHDAKEWKRCSDLWLAVAATTRGEAMAAPLYDAACCQAQGGEPDAAFATLDRAIAAGLNEPQIQDDVDLVPLHADPRWALLVAKIEEARAKAESAVAEPNVRSLLLVLEKDRDAARTSDDPKAVEVSDARTTQAMKDIVAKYGWPGKSLVGKDGAHAAWFVVQHSRDLEFQKSCLEKLELAVTQGEAQAVEHAYLYDRVAIDGGKPQRWGTQFDETTRKPFPIEDAERVDERRKAIGLSTMAEYERFLRETGARP